VLTWPGTERGETDEASLMFAIRLSFSKGGEPLHLIYRFIASCQQLMER